MQDGKFSVSLLKGHQEGDYHVEEVKVKVDGVNYVKKGVLIVDRAGV